MSTAIAHVEFTPEKVALLKRTLCPELTNDEMELFVGVAKRAGLDPFAKQIYGIKRKGKLTIQTGIDGFRLLAQRSGELDGQEGPFWCGDDGVWRDVWLDRTPPVAAKVIVYRKGCRHGFTGIAKFTEYAQTYNGGLTDMWARMGANQIAKCAEALALRKAFPADLSGLYVKEEMEQAGEGDTVDAEAAPAPVQQPARQLPAPQVDPVADAIARIRATKSLDELRTFFEGLPKNVQRQCVAAKDAQKDFLTPSQQVQTSAPATDAEPDLGDYDGEPEPPEGDASPDAEPRTMPAAEHRTAPPKADDVPRAGADMVKRLIELMHALDVNWAQIRDSDLASKGAAIAEACGLKCDPDMRINQLTAAESLKLKAELESRVAAKKVAKEKRDAKKAGAA